jgi:hypothetical protein
MPTELVRPRVRAYFDVADGTLPGERPPEQRTEMHIIVHWIEELRKRVPAA